MSCDWLNLGLQDPRITGSNDPITGTNDPGTSWFDLPLKSGDTIRLRRLPEFVSTRGGAYTFLPSLTAIRIFGIADVSRPNRPRVVRRPSQGVIH